MMLKIVLDEEDIKKAITAHLATKGYEVDEKSETPIAFKDDDGDDLYEGITAEIVAFKNEAPAAQFPYR